MPAFPDTSVRPCPPRTLDLEAENRPGGARGLWLCWWELDLSFGDPEVTWVMLGTLPFRPGPAVASNWKQAVGTGGGGERQGCRQWAELPPLSLQCLFLEILLRATFMKLLWSGRSRPSGPFLVTVVLQGSALLPDWGPPVTGPLAGGMVAFQWQLNSTARAAWRTPRLCLSASSLTPQAHLHY